MPKAVIVIPCYNEARRLDLAALDGFLADSACDLLFINDGSSDETGRLLDAFCQKRPARSQCIHRPHRGGKAEAVRQGLLAALQKQPPIVGYMDSDLATSLSDILRLVKGLEEARERGVTVVLGSRVKLLGHRITRNPFRHVVGRVFATAASLILDLPVYDTQCGAKFFRADPALQRAVSQPFHSAWVFDVELIARLSNAYRAAGKSVEGHFLEIPLDQWTDQPGSKIKPWDMLRAIYDLLVLAATKNRTSREA